MRTSLTVIAGVACLALCSFAGTALAHKQSSATTTTVLVTPDAPNSHRGTYSGKVSSPNPKCVANRKVFAGSDDGTIATATTDAAGNWTTPNVPLAAGGIGVAKKTLKKNKKHKHVCKSVEVTSF